VPQSASDSFVPLRVRNHSITAMAADNTYLHLLVADGDMLLTFSIASLTRYFADAPNNASDALGGSDQRAPSDSASDTLFGSRGVGPESSTFRLD